MMRVISAAELQAMSPIEMKRFAQEIGVSLEGLEDRESAIHTRLVQQALEIEDLDIG